MNPAHARVELQDRHLRHASDGRGRITGREHDNASTGIARAQGASEAPDRPVESASATTSRDNSAGNAPYIIVALALVAAMVVTQAVANGIGAVASYAAYGAASGSGNLESQLDDWADQWDDQWDGNGSNGQNPGQGNSGSGSGTSPDSGSSSSRREGLTSDNVFDLDYYAFDYSLADYVYASDYSGAQSQVSTYVHQLVTLDRDATSQVVSHVRAAASAQDDATRASELQQAQQLSQSMGDSIRALQRPQGVSGTNANEIADDLDDAVEGSLERWQSMTRLLQIMASPDGHTVGDALDADEDASELEDIATDLADALSASANK